MKIKIQKTKIVPLEEADKFGICELGNQAKVIITRQRILLI